MTSDPDKPESQRALDSYTKLIKICGITTARDAQMVVEAGCDAIGLVLCDSPRQVDALDAAFISKIVAGLVVRVGVFKDRGDRFILGAIDTIGLEAAQVYGTVSDELLEGLSARGVALIQAVSGATEAAMWGAAAVLADGERPGSGERRSLIGLHQDGCTKPLILAGGLRPDTVAQAIAATKAWGVDVSSGVESELRVKSKAKVEAFVANAREGFSVMALAGNHT